MEYRPIEITLISAKDLKDVNLLSKMDVYAVVTINGDPQTKQKTPVDKDCGSNPKWNHTMKFTVDDAIANQNRLNFVIRLVSDRKLGDRDIGEVVVPVKELLEGKDKVYDYSVRTGSGRPKGILNLSCKIGEKFSVPVAAPHPPMAEKNKMGETPVMAYPPTAAAGSSMGYPPMAGSSMAYPPPPPHGYPYNHQQPGGYGYPPPQHGYGAYPPPPQPGYGYPGYPPQAGYVKPPKKPSSGAGLGLGLAGGLLGGLLIGDMVSDIADNSAYDGGFDDGGFDF